MLKLKTGGVENKKPQGAYETRTSRARVRLFATYADRGNAHLPSQSPPETLKPQGPISIPPPVYSSRDTDPPKTQGSPKTTNP